MRTHPDRSHTHRTGRCVCGTPMWAHFDAENRFRGCDYARQSFGAAKITLKDLLKRSLRRRGEQAS